MNNNIYSILPYGLINLNVTITGGLRRLDRLSAAHRITAAGGTFKSNMSSRINVLVIADEKINQATTKTKKAGPGVIRISENQFYNLIGLF